LVISQNFSGHLVAHSDWPTPLKNKGVFFIKREMKPLPKGQLISEYLFYVLNFPKKHQKKADKFLP
jgi:hypothetical protein